MSPVASDRPSSIGVLIVDDQALVRAGFRMILEIEPDLHVVGEASAGGQAVAQVAALLPDVVLMDVRMPGPGRDCGDAAIMADASCRTRVVMLLVAGIRAVHAGEPMLSPTVTRRMIETYVDRPRAVDEGAQAAGVSHPLGSGRPCICWPAG